MIPPKYSLLWCHQLLLTPSQLRDRKSPFTLKKPPQHRDPSQPGKQERRSAKMLWMERQSTPRKALASGTPFIGGQQIKTATLLEKHLRFSAVRGLRQWYEGRRFADRQLLWWLVSETLCWFYISPKIEHSAITTCLPQRCVSSQNKRPAK